MKSRVKCYRVSRATTDPEVADDVTKTKQFPTLKAGGKKSCKKSNPCAPYKQRMVYLTEGARRTHICSCRKHVWGGYECRHAARLAQTVNIVPIIIIIAGHMKAPPRATPAKSTALKRPAITLSTTPMPI